ncbi:exodeoxyribonuclease V subunit beta [Paraferrimonas sedimenticola]|uniref:RecBCD enzyme subunit RecB n=1 Tax=Paraferrimonas sedimenticola TaxID=375674 RepID=A0AA37W2F9_9GAMM|nr:exodeoxyribonuclease V subunit beta [Paraferrimonas sedimenticola]GLP98050.1 RecBCD enzyme subunit RecB [Paraferrimonas sedimenticola]
MIRLDPCSVPLTGTGLIEASAGTGKTYTIASLYLRFIVEQPLFDYSTSKGVELKPENLLVVTFTRAATAELRDRIRQRLHQAVLCFRGLGAGDDLVLQHLYEAHQDEAEQVLKRLYAAEKSMDDASIFTIHGFCQRALNYNAIDANANLNAQMIEDESELVESACEDFWRQALYPLQGEQWRAVAAAMGANAGPGPKSATPDALARRLSGLLSRKSLVCEPLPSDKPLEQAIQEMLQQQQLAWEQLQWSQRGALFDIGEELASLPRISAAKVEPHINILGNWLAGEQATALPKTSYKYVAEKAEKNSHIAKANAFVAAVERFQRDSDLQPGLMSQALAYVKARLAEEKTRLNLMAPDDLMSQLHAGLTSAMGAQLATRLKQQYPVALIDEFQDTDPIQYGLFETIYQAEGPHCWLMIGDPKQSIYAFRGGDIHTYTQAKRGTHSERHYTLDKNYRSSQSMVEAVNDLFRFNSSNTFLDEQIGYQPVNSADQGGKGRLVVDQQAVSAMTLCLFDDEHIAGHHGAEYVAEQTAQLLDKARVGQALIGEKPVKPGDIAVLVRDRNEARDVAKALRARRVRSVFLSRQSVFESEIAADLYRVLLAIHQPKSRRHLMAALGCQSSGLSAEQIDQINLDENQWQNHQERFLRYQERWQYRGVLAAIQAWMYDYSVPGRLLSDELNGERALADLNHCAELLQAQALLLDGHYSLLRYFSEQIGGSGSDSNSQRIRLESDKDLVQIVTIHASKGLEYPIVMLPYGLVGREAKTAIYHGNGKTRMDFTQSELHLQQAEQERLAEDVRLLYVALTRASYACFVSLARRSKSHNATSAIEHLLCGAADSSGVLSQQLEALVEASEERIRTVDYQPELTLVADESESDAVAIEPQRFAGDVDTSWRITSYSGLSKNKRYAQDGEEKIDEITTQNDTSQDSPQPIPIPEEPSALVRNRFSFPRGANPGTALHGILENQHFAANQPDELAQVVESELNRYAIEEAPEWVESVTDWMNEVLTCQFAMGEGEAVSLGELDPNQALPEMEFFIAASELVNEHSFNRLLLEHPVLTVNPAALARLSFDSFRGLLKGFIDLTFEHQGRYYVCDYKSNHLGDSIGNYNQDSMQAMMASHRYDAQLVLYCLALHLYLKKLIPDYDYDLHHGGGVYLFLRGMQPGDPHSGVFYAKPERELIESLEVLFLGERAEVEPC